MKTTFFARRSLLILMVVVFLTPFALRGARMAVERTKNDVKDWLPSGFAETQELDWFRRNFLGEQFVLVSWEGCTAEDPRLALFTEKLFPHGQPQPGVERELDAGEKVGNRFSLYAVGDYFENWGGLNERWLKGEETQWYYLLPNGELYRWDDGGSMLTGIKHLLGVQVKGELVDTLDPSYYKYPHRAAAPLFKTVTTGPQVLASLVKEGGVLQNNPDEAIARLKGILYGPDGEQTCLVVTLTEAAKKNLHSTVGRGLLGKPRGRILTLAEQCGISEEKLRLGGPPVDNVAIDEEGTITLVRLVGLCIFLGLGLAYLCLRSISGTLIVFFVGGCSAVMSLSFVWWFGGSVDAIMMSMPALIYVLGISGAVHIVNYYREALDRNGPVGAPESAVAHGWKPAVMCSTTTALGLLSLYTSDILPIRNFGLYSAIGVMATVALLFTFLPAALQIWPMKPRKQASDDQPWLERQLAGFWKELGSFIIRHHRAVAIGCTLLVFGVGWGCFRMKTSVQLIKMFDGGAKIIQDYQWLEANVGKLVPMELVVRVDSQLLRQQNGEQDPAAAQDPNAPYQLSFLERMEISDRVQKVIEREFGEQGQQVVGQTMSAVTFAPKLPSAGGGLMAFAERGATSRRLEAHREDFLHSDYLRIDPENQAELWRISIRLGAFNDVDYGQFVGVLKSSVEPVLAAYTQRNAILHSILDQNQAPQVSGAKVMIVGAPFGLTSQARQSLTREQMQALKEKVEAAQAAILPGSPEANLAQQTRTFTTTLFELLRNARLRVDWHDPAMESPPADFAASLDQYDCVVLVGDSDAYDFAAIEASAKQVIDARGLHFDPAGPIASDPNRPTPVVSAVYTGVVPVVYKAQRTLLESLVESTFWSFITITPIMMFVSRGVFSGTVAMLPNIAPVFLIFGAMGWLGIEVDIGSMMTASIALGVSVDDTIHYLNWFRANMSKGASRREAILAAYQHCATPTFQTAVISGVGLSIFAASTFTPTQRFGYLMLTILLMGMFAELIFFPALLASPLGRLFEPHPKTPPSKDAAAPELKLITIEGVEPATVAAPAGASGPHRPLGAKFAGHRRKTE